jgi:hypothetical protein
METLKFQINTMEELYSKFDGNIKNINIIANVYIGDDNKFIYNVFMNASNFFINNNPHKYSFISIIGPFDTNDNIYWSMIDTDINISYKITIELTIYKNNNYLKLMKKKEFINYKYDYNNDYYLVDYI